MPAGLQVSGNKLQENFEYLDRKKELPDGVQGDMLYHDGNEWVRLSAPSGSSVFVLSHNGTIPSWLETEGCE